MPITHGVEYCCCALYGIGHRLPASPATKGIKRPPKPMLGIDRGMLLKLPIDRQVFLPLLFLRADLDALRALPVLREPLLSAEKKT
jgi:hypothetical protein